MIGHDPASMTILFPKKVLFKVESQFLFCEILDFLKFFNAKIVLFHKKAYSAQM